MQFLAKCIQSDFHIFDNRVAIGLLVERLLFGALDGVLQQVVETSNAGRLALVDELFAAARNEHVCM